MELCNCETHILKSPWRTVEKLVATKLRSQMIIRCVSLSNPLPRGFLSLYPRFLCNFRRGSTLPHFVNTYNCTSRMSSFISSLPWNRDCHTLEKAQYSFTPFLFIQKNFLSVNYPTRDSFSSSYLELPRYVFPVLIIYSSNIVLSIY